MAKLAIVLLGPGGLLPIPARSQPQIASTAGVLNAASLKSGPVAPGEIIYVLGRGLGPDERALGQVSAVGKLGTALSGTRVLFDGVAASLINTSSLQLACIVPYGVAGKTTTSVVVEYQGRPSPPVTLPVQPAAPALFTADASGSRQASALNEDFSVNSVFRPATIGSLIFVYGTGEGQTTPPGIDGQVNTDLPPKPAATVRASISGQPAEIVYVGGVPFSAAGLFLVALRVPAGLLPGNADLQLQIGSSTTQLGVTVAATVGPSTCPAQGIAYNTSLQATLTTNDCKLNPRGPTFYTKAYEFDAVTGDNVQISMKPISGSFAAIVFPPGSQIADGYAAGNGLAQIGVPIFTSGKWRVEVSSYTAGGTGSYELTLLRIATLLVPVR